MPKRKYLAITSLCGALVLVLVVLDGRLDGIFGEHAAVQLHGGKLQVRSNIGVLIAMYSCNCAHIT
jgi:hypothetical protein